VYGCGTSTALSTTSPADVRQAHRALVTAINFLSLRFNFEVLLACTGGFRHDGLNIVNLTFDFVPYTLCNPQRPVVTVLFSLFFLLSDNVYHLWHTKCFTLLLFCELLVWVTRWQMGGGLASLLSAQEVVNSVFHPSGVGK